MNETVRHPSQPRNTFFCFLVTSEEPIFPSPLIWSLQTVAPNKTPRQINGKSPAGHGKVLVHPSSRWPFCKPSVSVTINPMETNRCRHVREIITCAQSAEAPKSNWRMINSHKGRSQHLYGVTHLDTKCKELSLRPGSYTAFQLPLHIIKQQGRIRFVDAPA